jgi:toxin ParE1/3/4
VKPVTINAAAERELREAVVHYDGERAGLGGEFRAEFEAAVGRVRHDPLAYAVDDTLGARFCPLRRFPYTIFYVDLGDHIWIAAVAHQHRRPGYWTRRRPD